ncbi:coiled-coil domain-containing protein 42 like-2 [Acanthochromis polyacanthus]|uniref:coiled-coil domain-containing protein 42 like-2 n=1 Tax=Acanthochromis polyacanthus TaxID=80966 RepID=UPI002234A022|nr:coiled-coil domain-containing protein 42 like-2 [Acanthochromis polyacanthus]
MEQNRLPSCCHDNSETIPAHSPLSGPRLPGNSYTNPGKHPEETIDRPSDRPNVERTAGRVSSELLDGASTDTMTTCSLPVLVDGSGSRPNVKAENGIRNVFVTQSVDNSHRKEEHVSQTPAATETSSRLREAGVYTLQKSLVLKKQAELSEVDKRLALKRQEFKESVEALAQRRSELEEKQQQTKEKVMKFEKFVAENELKRRRMLKTCEATREQNILKKREIEDLTEQLKHLRVRKQVLKERMTKYKIYEDYLMKTLENLPGNYLDNGSESLVMPIIRRHETLSITHQELLQRFGRMEEQVEQGHRQLQNMKQEHSIKKLMARKEVSELQSELETLKEKNKQTEVNLMTEQGLSREKTEEVGRLLMAVNNLAEQCYMPTYGPLESMNVLTMMDMVKECILDKADTHRRVRRLMESGSAMASTTAVTDKRGRGSLKGIGSKTQIKSSSKVSRKSEAFS